MIPPASHLVPVYPGIKIGATIRAILGDAAVYSLCDGRTLEDLRRRQVEIEQKLCTSAGTDKQLRALNREKKSILKAISDKEIADGFMNGSLVPYLEHRKGQQVCTFVPSSDNRRQIRKAKAYLGRVVRAHRRELNESNFDGTRRKIRAKSEDKKIENLSSGRSYCSLQQCSLEVLKSSPQVPRTAPTLSYYAMQVRPRAKAQ